MPLLIDADLRHAIAFHICHFLCFSCLAILLPDSAIACRHAQRAARFTLRFCLISAAFAAALMLSLMPFSLAISISSFHASFASLPLSLPLLIFSFHFLRFLSSFRFSPCHYFDLRLSSSQLMLPLFSLIDLRRRFHAAAFAIFSADYAVFFAIFHAAIIACRHYLRLR
jgi:hypothetical protein